MKVVIISHNCFPYISPRSNRATELAKEFARQGHETILYALLGSVDYTEFQKDTGIVVKNLGTSHFGLQDNSNNRSNNKLYKAFTRVAGRYFDFPKCELKNMTFNALEAESEMDLLITITHPHTIHWGAAKFVKKHPGAVKCWIGDCGDPYMLNPHTNYPWYFKYVEKKWCSLCDYITIPIEEGRKAYYPEFAEKIKVIPQGFDFVNNRLAEYEKNERPTFAFAGIFYENLRDPKIFFEYLCSIKYDFKFTIYINDTPYYRTAFCLNEYQEKLGDKLEIHNFIPRSQLLYELSKMDFVLNIRNKSGVQQPSKLIDYALTKRPILEITSDFKEQPVFVEFLNGDYTHQTIVPNIERYDIRNVVKEMLNLTK